MEKALETMIGKMAPLLDERQRRIFLGLAADVAGRGGVAEVVALTSVGKNTVYQGHQEEPGRHRRTTNLPRHLL